VREKIDLSKAKASAVTLCFHKSGGPKGIGLLYLKSKTQLEPIVRGGSQEKKRRAGTENIVAICGAAALAEEAAHLHSKFQTSVREVRDYFESQVKTLDVPIQIVGEKVKRLPNTSYILFPGHKADLLMMHLDLECICVSSGSACSSGIPTAPRSILSLGYSEEEALCGLRFSLGPLSTKAEADKIVSVLKKALSKKKTA